MATLKSHKARLEAMYSRDPAPLKEHMLAGAVIDIIEHLTAASEPRYVDEPNQAQRVLDQAQRIRELENTINQLKMQNKKLKAKVSERDTRIAALMHNLLCEQSGCRKDDTQVDGWIPWSGGEHPVHHSTTVEAKLRCGGIVTRCVENLDWRNDGHPGDIIAYRIAE